MEKWWRVGFVIAVPLVVAAGACHLASISNNNSSAGGKPTHWLIWVVIMIAPVAMGKAYLQTSDFNLFLAVIVALGVGAVVAVLLTTSKGEQVTRENFDDAEWEQSAADE